MDEHRELVEGVAANIEQLLQVTLDNQSQIDEILRFSQKTVTPSVSKPIIVIDKVKSVAVRIGSELLFTYPDSSEEYDTIVGLEVYLEYVKIVEKSKSFRSTRTHLIKGADVVTWV